MHTCWSWCSTYPHLHHRTYFPPLKLCCGPDSPPGIHLSSSTFTFPIGRREMLQCRYATLPGPAKPPQFFSKVPVLAYARDREIINLEYQLQSPKHRVNPLVLANHIFCKMRSLCVGDLNDEKHEMIWSQTRVGM